MGQHANLWRYLLGMLTGEVGELSTDDDSLR